MIMRQNDDMIFREPMRNEQDICTVEQCDKCIEKTWRCAVAGRTASELHEAMMRSKKHDFDDEPFDEIESELDYYNL